jgi:hypothetical protein
MRTALTLVLVGLVGLFGAASIGYAAYIVSRDTVGVPVTKVKLSPNELAPARTTRTVTEPAPPPPPSPTSTDRNDDDNSGRGRGRGRGGGDNSGKGGGGDDDD